LRENEKPGDAKGLTMTGIGKSVALLRWLLPCALEGKNRLGELRG